MGEVTVTRETETSFDAVWGLVADFGDTSWMKGVTKVEVEGEGVGMVRNIYAGAEGSPVREQLTGRDDQAHWIEYSIPEGNPMPVDDYHARVSVTPNGDGARIEWSSTFAPRGVDDAAAKATVEGMYGVLIDWVLERAANR